MNNHPIRWWALFIVAWFATAACSSSGTGDASPDLTDVNPPPLPHCGEQSPVYIWVFGHHYLGGGGVYPRGQDLRDVVAVANDLDVPTTFFFDGILVQELIKEDPGVFSTLVGNPRVSFGYHGEETHGPYPVPVSPSNAKQSMTHLEDWDAAVDLTVEYATTARTYSFIDADAAIREIDRMAPWEYKTEQSGGVALVHSVLGDDLAVATYHGLAAPPVQQGFRSVWTPAVQQATYPVVSHGLPKDTPDDVKAQLFELGGGHDLMVHMGALTTKARPEMELPNGVKDIQKALNTLDRSRPRLLLYGLHVAPGDTSGLRDDLIYLKEEFLPANPGSRFVALEELPDLVHGVGSARVPADSLGALAQAVMTGFASGRPPDSIVVGEMHFSLSDAFEILATALKAHATAGGFPPEVTATEVLGPIGPGASIAHCGKRTLTVGNVVTSALASLEAIAKSETDQRPRRIPYSVQVDGLDCNPAEVLLALARSVAILDGGGTADTEVIVEEMGLIPPVGDALDAVIDSGPLSNPLWLAKLQLWSVRGAPFRCEQP